VPLGIVIELIEQFFLQNRLGVAVRRSAHVQSDHRPGHEVRGADKFLCRECPEKFRPPRVEGVKGADRKRLAEAAGPGAEDELARLPQHREVHRLVNVDGVFEPQFFEKLPADGQDGQLKWHLKLLAAGGIHGKRWVHPDIKLWYNFTGSGSILGDY
jgi:hypothetical protein